MKLLRNLLLASLTLLSVFGFGCSSDPDASSPDQASPPFDANYAIIAYIANGSEVQEVQFRQAPQTEPLTQPLRVKDVTFEADAGAPNATTASAAMTDLARLAISECGARKVPDTMLTLQPELRTGSCTVRQPVLGKPYSRVPAVAGFSNPSAPTYANEPSCGGLEATPQPFLFFYNEPKTAAQVLQYQETIVCAAAKLADLADSEKPVSWKYGLYGVTGTRSVAPTGSYVDLPTSPPLPSNTDNGPPQVSFRVVQPKDKFLVRDLAIDLLSYVLLLDEFPLTVGVQTTKQTASQVFTAAAVAAPAADVASAAYNGGPAAPATVVTTTTAPAYYPPITVNSSGALDWPATARKHLEMETANLRATGQLLQDLITKNVYAAMGGAAQKAATLPPSERGKSFWLDGSDGNSIAEIARVLFGRQGTLGMASNPSPAPPVSAANCRVDVAAPTFWMLPANAWTQTAPAGLTQRGADVPAVNGLGQRADRFLSASRVVPTANDPPAVRTAIYGQVSTNLAASLGLTVPQLEATPTGEQLKNQLARLTDGNIRSAVTRQASTLRALSNAPVSQNQLQAMGLAVTPITGGFTVNKTLDRNLYNGDMFGPLGPIQMASECTGTSNGPATDYVTTYAAVNGDPLTAGNAGRPAGAFTPRALSHQFQDAFTVGQAVRTRLVLLRETTRGVSLLNTAPDEDVKARAGALFELDGWAGGTRVIVRPGAQFTVSLVDVNPADYGVSASQLPSEVQAAFALAIASTTAPPPATDGDIMGIAQCASGTRTEGCPANAANYVWKPDLATITTSSDLARGRLRSRWDLRFQTTGLPAAGVPTFVNGQTPSAIAKFPKFLLRTKGATFSGQILGSTQAQGSWTGSVDDFTTTFAVSPLRRKLVNAVFGFPSPGDDLNSTLADTRDYCIPGVPRNVFVPLENELTSDSDSYESSWRHYLTLAKQSAQRADELGRELIDIGTRIEERKEVASDKVEQLIGGPFDKECLETNAAQDRDYGKCSDAIKAGLSASKVDIVLLTQDPGASNLINVLQCNNPLLSPESKPSICAKLSAGAQAVRVAVGDTVPSDATKVYYTNLDIVKVAPPPQISVSECSGPELDPYTRIESFLYPTNAEGAARWSSDDARLREAIRSAKLVVESDANFHLDANGFSIIDTRKQTGANQPWPGCLRGDSQTGTSGADRCGLTTNSTNNTKANLNKALHALFRACPSDMGDLGSCNAPHANQWEELTGMRWHLMGALWLAASLSGQVPPGMFDIPIPAANFPGTALTQSRAVACALPITVYGPARFVDVGGKITMNGFVTDMKQADHQALVADGDVAAVHANFGFMPTSGDAELPFWYRAIYNSTGITADTCYRNFPTTGVTYYHVRARNSLLTSDTDPLKDWINASGGGGAAGGQGLLLQGWRALAHQGEVNDPTFPNAVASVKTWFNTNTPGMQFYHDHFAPGYFMIAPQFRGANPNDQYGPPPVVGLGLGHEYPTQYRWHDVGGDPIYKANVQFDCNDSARADWGNCAFAPGEGKPSTQPPSIRARFFANSLAPMAMLGAKRQFAEASALSCVLTLTPAIITEGETPPPLTGIQDLKLLDGWIAGREELARQALAGLYVENVPMQTIESFKSSTSGAGGLKGQMGVVAIEAATAMRGIARSYNAATHTISQSRSEVAGLQATLRGVDVQADINAKNAWLKRLQHLEVLASSVSKAVSFNPAEIAKGLVQAAVASGPTAVAFPVEEALNNSLDAQLDVQRQQALINSTRQLAQYRKDQNDAIAELRNSVSTLQTKLLILEQMKKELSGALERATGSGAWTCKDASNKDIVCRSYVNSVLNARYSGTRIRYENALIAARASAYYARRAIEQRMGVRLDTIETNIGPLEAPSKWADRVCTMHGVDFDALKKESVTADPAEKRAWEELRGREYANSFIGDYVEMLNNFVEFYNVAYPSQDGNDTLLLSMREDIERQTGECSGPSTNRLANSEVLGQNSEVKVSVDRRWELHVCAPGETKCTDLRSWLRDTRYDAVLPLPLSSGRIDRGAWLVTRARRNAATQEEQGIPGATGFVSQAVVLPAGSYALSFRDVGIDISTGNPATSSVYPYRATIFDESGIPVTTGVFTPALSTVANYSNPITAAVYTAVDTQRVMRFTVASSGRYRVGFSPASLSGRDGSVMIFAPQLERDIGTAPTPYQATDADGLTRGSNCASDSVQLRARFLRKCDTAGAVAAPARCYYEAKDPFIVDTAQLAVNGTSLADKLAADNFNYRHVDFALNLVGTGLRSCDENPTPGCYANGTLEYDIVHEANQVGIVGYDREARRFDFGEGAIRHGKALTAERYLTLPLSGADTSLLSGTGITKTELRGRPLDGRYRVRIYESPALRWSNLEDIQLMIRYRYWSRVTSPTP